MLLTFLDGQKYGGFLKVPYSYKVNYVCEVTVQIEINYLFYIQTRPHILHLEEDIMDKIIMNNKEISKKDSIELGNKNNNMADNTIINILPTAFREYISFVNMDGVEEIRLRVGRNAILYFGPEKGELVTDYTINQRDLQEALEYITGFSLYAYEDDIREGFITIKGGHRVGIAGKIVREEGRIKTISNISSINIRVSHQVYGCGDKLMSYLVNKDKVFNTLIISPPGAGKTTLLRDVLRQLSDTYMQKVSLVDERSEIASCYKGIPQNNVGMRTDVYDCCPKTEGIMLMIRAMSPQVVAVDELGNALDMKAIEEATGCGCKVIATIHGDTVEDIAGKSYMESCIRDKLFKRYVFIKSGQGREVEVFDENLCRISG